MKCGVRISKSEFKNIIFYAIVNLIAGYYVTVNIIFQENV